MGPRVRGDDIVMKHFNKKAGVAAGFGYLFAARAD
jgi:hypothetical protein